MSNSFKLKVSTKIALYITMENAYLGLGRADSEYLSFFHNCGGLSVSNRLLAQDQLLLFTENNSAATPSYRLLVIEQTGISKRLITLAL